MGKSLDEIERMLDGLISIHNALEDKVQEMSFNIKFLRAWIKEHQKEHGKIRT